MADLPALTFYRAALERERKFHRDAARCRRVSASVVGPVVFMYGSTARDPDGPVLFAVVGSIWVGLYLLGAVGGGRRARDLQRQLAEVDRLVDSAAPAS